MQKILDFVNDMQDRATKDLVKVSGSGKATKEVIDFKSGQAEVITVRGGAIEKAAITKLTLKDIKPPAGDKTVSYMVYQMEIFPENPYCPMGHFNTEWSLEGQGPYHMNLDLFPALPVEEDLKLMTGLMDKVADQFSRDRVKMREGLDEHYNMAHWAKPLATKVGCKLLNLNNQDLDLFISAYHTFFDGYIEIVRKEKDTPYTEADKKAKIARNSRWLEYITIKDQAVRLGLAAGIPPQVLIALSYPPLAAF
jgi:coproporphyrinogen III oxidase